MADQSAQFLSDGGATYLRLRFECVTEDGWDGDPDLDAPVLRRVLGKALVERFCVFGRPVCEDGDTSGPAERCDLAGACPYGVLFAGSLTARPPFALFVPPHVDHGVDSTLPVELTLFGPAVRTFAWAIDAVVRACAAGFGARRQRYTVDRISRIHLDATVTTLCDANQSLPARILADRLPLFSEAIDPDGLLLVHFLSPARLKADGRLLMGPGAPPFAVLVARVLDRYRDLFSPAGEDVIAASLRRGLIALAQHVPVLVDEVEWVEVEDYSARKRQELRLGGKVGRVLYGPGAAACVHLLRLGEILHVGKNAASGCGRIMVQAAENPS